MPQIYITRGDGMYEGKMKEYMMRKSMMGIG